MKKLSLTINQSFSEYLKELRESMEELSRYYALIGKQNNHIKTVHEGLNHSDPFIIYKASLAASLMLANKSIYH